MPRIRIATFNVRAAWGPAQRAIGRLLAERNIDVVCLQECWPDCAAGILDAMGPAWQRVIPSAPNTGGEDATSNAILSRLPMRDARVVPMVLDGPYDERSALLASCALPHDPARAITVCCTHLDQQRAEARLAQWSMLRPLLRGPSLVCGDLNALRRADYDAARWRAIAQARAHSDWEAPVEALTAALARQGFRDAWSEAGAGMVEGTCAYQTRVDYIMRSGDLPGRFVPGSYRRHPTIEAGLSDHALVWVDVALE